MKIYALDTVNSQSGRIGDIVRFTIAEEAVIDEMTIIPQGTKICGYIAEVKKASGWGCPGKIRIDLLEATVGSREVISLPVGLEKRGEKPNFLLLSFPYWVDWLKASRRLSVLTMFSILQ